MHEVLDGVPRRQPIEALEGRLRADGDGAGARPVDDLPLEPGAEAQRTQLQAEAPQCRHRVVAAPVHEEAELRSVQLPPDILATIGAEDVALGAHRQNPPQPRPEHVTARARGVDVRLVQEGAEHGHVPPLAKLRWRLRPRAVVGVASKRQISRLLRGPRRHLVEDAQLSRTDDQREVATQQAGQLALRRLRPKVRRGDARPHGEPLKRGDQGQQARAPPEPQEMQVGRVEHAQARRARLVDAPGKLLLRHEAVKNADVGSHAPHQRVEGRVVQRDLCGRACRRELGKRSALGRRAEMHLPAPGLEQPHKLH